MLMNKNTGRFDKNNKFFKNKLLTKHSLLHIYGLISMEFPLIFILLIRYSFCDYYYYICGEITDDDECDYHSRGMIFENFFFFFIIRLLFLALW
jgi:hypothetical protein